MKRSLCSAAIFLSLSLFVCVKTGNAQILTTPETAGQTGMGGSNVIIGTVFSPAGLPIRTRVRVRLSAMRGGDRITITDESGNYAFRGLPSGNYSVSIDREPEYKSATQSVEVMQFRGAPPNTYTLNFRLEFLDEKRQSKPAVIDAVFAGVPPKALEYYNIALDHARIGQHEAAIGYLERAIEEHRNFMIAYNEKGVQHLKLKEFEKAEATLRQALELDAAAFAPNMNLGIVLYQTDRHPDAVTHFLKALDARPNDLSGHYMLGRALADQGRFDDAEKHLLRAVSSDNRQMAAAHRILGTIYESRGEKKLARSQYEAYLKAVPDAPDAEEIRNRIVLLRG